MKPRSLIIAIATPAMIEDLSAQLPEVELIPVYKAMNMKETYKEKLRALLEGLGTQHIDLLMKDAKVRDYRTYGEGYTKPPLLER
jgi:hypothetical protein